ncbi:MAG: nucleotide exchange factor GrpE [Bacillota bacterium]|nr:nucleotide exchange factor GrpE [Bacillota bacterium]
MSHRQSGRPHGDPWPIDLEQVQGDLEAARRQVESANAEVQAARAEVERTRAEQETLRAALEQARKEQEAIRADLEEAVKKQEKLEADLEATRQLAEQNWEQFLRARADLDNYRRRMEREVERLVERGRQELLLRFLEVADNFQRALMPQASVDPDGLRRGLELISRQLDNLLRQEGVEPVEAVGAPFDPRLHEAVAVWECDEVERETVTDEIQKGYLYRGELLRPARVRVGRPPAGR